MKPGEACGPPQVINLFLMSADWISGPEAQCVIKAGVEKANTSSRLCLIKKNLLNLKSDNGQEKISSE